MVDLGNGQIKARERGEGGDRGGKGRGGKGEGWFDCFFACCYQGILKMILTLNPLSRD